MKYCHRFDISLYQTDFEHWVGVQQNRSSRFRNFRWKSMWRKVGRVACLYNTPRVFVARRKTHNVILRRFLWDYEFKMSLRWISHYEICDVQQNCWVDFVVLAHWAWRHISQPFAQDLLFLAKLYVLQIGWSDEDKRVCLPRSSLASIVLRTQKGLSLNNLEVRESIIV
jgi:hypothetical protein